MPDRFADGCEMIRIVDTGAFCMTIDKAAFIVPVGAGRGNVLSVFGQSITERITAEDSGGDYYVFDEVTPPGMGVPPHKDKIVLVIEGEFEVYLDSKISKAGPGTILNFARGTFHGFRCVGDKPGKTTWIVTPGLNGQTFIRELATFPPGPPDFPRLDALHAKHGINMPPPSPNWW
jgi:quercetin dioxygenase-like cupin family protein